MSEILTFNLPISISRERWDAIIREAARKVYTEGLVDPGEALMPEVAKAATAVLQPPPGIVCEDGQQVLPLPVPAEPTKPEKEGGLDRTIPAGALERMHNYIRARSVPTAALLAQKASIVRWASDGHVEIKIAAPFARQFNNQPAKARGRFYKLLVDAVREVFGSDAYPRFIVLTDAVINADDLMPPRAVECLKRLRDIFVNCVSYRHSGRNGSGAYWVTYCAVDGEPVGPAIAYLRERRPDRLLLCYDAPGIKKHNIFKPWGTSANALLQAGAIIPRNSKNFTNRIIIDGSLVYGLLFSVSALKNFNFKLPLIEKSTEDTP